MKVLTFIGGILEGTLADELTRMRLAKTLEDFGNWAKSRWP